MASWSSQRQMVDPEIEATIPWRITSSWMSGTNSRDSGSSRVLGSSQATALTAITTSGGKNPRPTLPRGLLQSLQALFEEALAPLAHGLAGQVHPGGDLLVGEILGGIQHHLRPDHVSIR